MDNVTFTVDKLHDWEAYLTKFSLPEWEKIPDIGLYMDQVVSYLENCLDYLPPELKKEQFITPATINNYVRIGYMPRPTKKRYYRIHLAYLIVICSLKQTLSMSLISRALPNDLSEEDVEVMYSNFANVHGKTIELFLMSVSKGIAPMLGEECLESPVAVDKPETLVAVAAVMAGLNNLLAEKLLLLEYPSGKNLELPHQA